MRFLVIAALAFWAVSCDSARLDAWLPASTQTVSKATSQEQIRRFQANPGITIAVLTGHAVLEKMLESADGRGVWLLFGRDADSREKIVFAPLGSETMDVYDASFPCPPYCSPLSGELGVSISTSHGAPGMDPASIGQAISRDDSIAMTSTFRRTATGVAGQRFERAVLERLLGDDRVHGLWFFYGRSDEGERTILAYPADAHGELFMPFANGSLLEAPPDAVIGYTGSETCTVTTCPEL